MYPSSRAQAAERFGRLGGCSTATVGSVVGSGVATSGALVAYLVRNGRLAERGSLEVDVRMGIEMGRPSRVRVRREIDALGASRLSVFGTARATNEVAG